jgi:signal transduction histidine kinase
MREPHERQATSKARSGPNSLHPHHFTQAFFRRFLRPLQAKADLRNREVVLITLIAGSLGMIIALLFLLLVGYFILGTHLLLGRILLCLALGVFLLILYLLARNKQYKLSASLLIIFYGLLAIGLSWTWGINLPFAILLYCFMIVLSGILLGSRFALYSTALAIGTLVGIQVCKEFGWHIPDESWLNIPAYFGDAIGSSIVLLGLGFVSWLYGHQNEQSLARAQLAEQQLLAEQAQLETKIEERTLELQIAQFKEMQQLYRFAEVGHLSAAMLHELANHLTVLTFNIDDLAQAQHSQSIQRARNSINYLEHMVDRISSRLHSPGKTELFPLETLIQESLSLFESKARGAQVKLQYKPDRISHELKGDPIQLSQALGVLIANAIEAYDSTTSKNRVVDITTDYEPQHIIIAVVDYGPGIPKSKQAQLFEPFYSTKEQGMGIGLFIAKGMIETYFHGTITVKSNRNQTVFSIALPHEST